MPELLDRAFGGGGPTDPWEVLLRLVAALVLGTGVAWVYRRTRRVAGVTGSFPTTLVLLSILIAMVTQVIGDNIARAFSLVGALSIVRFRTVVRDTEDTAYVIFAVAVGMAVGACDLWVALLGLGVIGVTAFGRRLRPGLGLELPPAVRLNLRLALGADLEALLAPVWAAHVTSREMVAVETARQGIALDVAYDAVLRPQTSADALVRALNRVEGVQGVQLERRLPEAG